MEQCISASSGALFVSLFNTPLDVVKVRMQHKSSIMSLECEHPNCAGTSTSSIAVRVARHEVRSTMQS